MVAVRQEPTFFVQVRSSSALGEIEVHLHMCSHQGTGSGMQAERLVEGILTSRERSTRLLLPWQPRHTPQGFCCLLLPIARSFQSRYVQFSSSFMLALPPPGHADVRNPSATRALLC